VRGEWDRQHRPSKTRDQGDRRYSLTSMGRLAFASAGGVRHAGSLPTSARPAQHPLLTLQRTAGNHAVQRLVAELMVQRDDTAKTGASRPGGVTTGSATFTGSRPTPTTTAKSFAACSDAADYLNSGSYVGDAHPVFAPTTSSKIIPTKDPGGGFKATTSVTWALDPSSTMELTKPTWPKMTTADNAAVAAFLTALRAHENGHFDVQGKVLTTKAPTSIWAYGATAEEALSNLQSEANERLAALQTELDTKDAAYDTATEHGGKQSAVGGTNVHLECPGAG